MLKVGELAALANLTVRTLHHYDDIGLLRPSARSDAGYRLYSRDDVARLHQIQALRAFGMGLAAMTFALRWLHTFERDTGGVAAFMARLNVMALREEDGVGMPAEVLDYVQAFRTATATEPLLRMGSGISEPVLAWLRRALAPAQGVT
jgi:DNA-binding transcriptional MerR regulator